MKNVHSRSGRALLWGVVVLTLALVAAFVAFLGRSESPGGPGPGQVAGVEAEAESEASDPSAASSPDLAVDSGASMAVREASTVETVGGLVVGADGLPLPGVGVGFGEERKLESGPDGRFRLPFSEGLLQVVDERWGSLRGRALGSDEASASGSLLEVVLVAAPRVNLAGRVSGTGGLAIPGAELRVEFGELPASFPHALEGAVAPEASATSDDGGGFALAAVPYVLGSKLVVEHPGWNALRRPLPPVSREDLDLRLRAVDPGRGSVSGVVLDAAGRPASGAEVRLGNRSTRSGADGGFRIEPLHLRDETPLAAVLPGEGFAVIEGFGLVVRESDGRPAPATLRLGGESLEIRGRVEETGEAPKASAWRVQLLDPTELSIGLVPPVSLESMTSGSSRGVTCGADGSFVLQGLAARDYRLVAIDTERLMRIESEPIRAGATDVRLRVDSASLLTDLTGRVVDPRGMGIEGVSVKLVMRTSTSQSVATFVDGPVTSTGSGGVFRFEGVPRSGIELVLDGEAILPTRRSLTGKPGELELTILRRVRVEFDAATLGADVDRIRFLDEGGRSLPTWIFTDGGWRTSSSPEVVDRRSAVLAVAESAATVIWYGAGQELGRQELQLRIDALNTIRP